MKRVAFWILPLALCAAPLARAQDAATEQRLRELSGRIEALIASQESQRKLIESVAREVRTLQEQQNAPKPDYASHEDLKHLRDKVAEIDRKRMDDNEKIRAEFQKLAKLLATPPPVTKKSGGDGESEPSEKPAKPQKGFEYTVQRGDTLSTIIQACRDQNNVKVTTAQILKANPGLKPERLLVGQKIFIPVQ